MLSAPKNLTVKPRDGAALSSWDSVVGADGYVLHFYRADSSDVCFKTRYSQNCSKMILGFKNGEEYLVRVRAFCYENGKESMGELSDSVMFVPVCNRLKVQHTVCLNVGESAALKWEYKNTVPDVHFTSSDDRIATVDENGTVTAKAVGKAEITLTMENGETAVANIEIGRDLSPEKSPSAVILLAGDMMCALNHQRAAKGFSFDFTEAFSEIKPLLSSADFAVGVLETTCFDGAPYECEQIRLDSGSPNCNSPSTFIRALCDAGFDALVTANNHNCDTGRAGLHDTVRNIKNSGMYNIGTLNDNPVVVDINGIKTAIIACNMISNGTEQLCCENDDERIIGKYSPEYFGELVNSAQKSGAEYIIAYQHFGKMNSSQVRRAQETAARQMAQLGADIIICSHPHVLQQFDYISASDGRRVPCAYSLGNFVTTMSELRENRESAVIRLTLTKNAEDGGITTDVSYIPVISADNERGAAVKPLLNPITDSEKSAVKNISDALGDKIHPTAKPKLLLQGSVVLRKIFEQRSDCTADSGALIISQLTLCGKDGEKADKGEAVRVRLDIEKSFLQYAKNSRSDYIAVDFYTAAAVSCYRLGDNFYTASKAFEKSMFYIQNKDSFEKISPPFSPKLWKPALKSYADMLKCCFNNDRIILIRLNFSDKCAKVTELRNGTRRDGLNRRIREMEQYFIDLVNPIVIDVAQYYFADGSDSSPSAFEPYFYIHVNKIISQILSGSAKSYYAERDISLWTKRVIKYYGNMTARAYQSWLLDGKSAADLLIQYTSKEFVAENADRFIKLKSRPDILLCDTEKLLDGDGTADEFIRAAMAVDALLKGNISESYDFYSVIFKRGFNAVKLMAGLLNSTLKIPVGVHNCEIVFLLKDNRQGLTEYFNCNKPVKVDVWGSCVSRETLNRIPNTAEVSRYIFKQPPVLAFEPDIPYRKEFSADKFCNNKWRSRTVKEAFNHEGTRLLKNSGGDWLVVDFYDLICREMMYNGGLFETDDFIQRTDFYKEISSECRATYLFDEKTEEFCDENMTRFADFVKSRYSDRIILVKIDLKDKYITLDNRLDTLSDSDNTLDKKRRFIARYEEMFCRLTDCRVIDISRHFYADDSFPLGGAHIVHYESEFYSQCAMYIEEIIKGSDKRFFGDADENYLLLRDLRLGI